MRKIFLVVFVSFVLFLFVIGMVYKTEPQKINRVINFFAKIKYNKEPTNLIEKEAKKQIGKVLSYDLSQGYYKEGRPPDKTTGVCTDVIGDAFKNLGFDLQNMVFEDIKHHPDLYPDKPDKNINFRRAKNLNVYFKRFATSLTTSLDKRDLDKWQGGDIVIWKDHVAIISSLRRKDKIPYVISNHGRGVVVADLLKSWPKKIIGHYRVDTKFFGK